MSDVVTAAVAYIDRRLATMRRAPKSWGSPESLELQALLLLELRTFLLRRRTHAGDPYEVRDAYARFLAQRFPDLPGRFMIDAIPAEDLAQRMPDRVMALRDEVVSSLGPEDPFQTAALAVEVRFRPGLATPPFAKAARYVARLLGAIGKVVRGTGGRSTDVAVPLPDIRLAPGNDDTGPGILFAFDPVQGDRAAVQGYWDALAKLVHLVASFDEAPGPARLREMFPDSREREVVVGAARRLYPRSTIVSATLGGQGLGRAPLRVEAQAVWRLDALVELSQMDLGVPETWIPAAPPPLPSAPPRLASEPTR